MNEVIHDLMLFFREETDRDHISIRTNLSPNLPRIEGDRVQLKQVLQNLVINGMDAMQVDSGREKELWISTKREDSGEVAVEVKDSGVGFSSEGADKIFQPFFSTKPQGIGVGLSISRSIVEAHGGHLSAAENPDGGAIFKFTLPV